MEKNKQTQIVLPIAIIVAGLLIAAAIMYRPTPPAQKSIEAVRPIDQADHVRGRRDAALTIVEYSDLECPFCKRFHETLLKVYEKYGASGPGRAGQVAWAYRHLPLPSLHSKAETEAIALECAGKLGGNDIFWQYMDAIFSTTNSNNSLDLTILPKLATELGLKTADFDTCVKDPSIKAIIDKDVANADDAGASGTPFVVIIAKDGKRTSVAGAVPFETIDQTIADLLTK